MVAQLIPGLTDTDTVQAVGNSPDGAAPAGDGGDAMTAVAVATNLFLGLEPSRPAGNAASTGTGSAASPDIAAGFVVVADGGTTELSLPDMGFPIPIDPRTAPAGAAPATIATAVMPDGGGSVTVADGSGAAPNATFAPKGATKAQILSALDATSLGFVGSGVTVGVLSDSFNNRGGAAADEADGALPTSAGVDVLKDDPGGTGSDEGRAMMQIVHDVASGADLDFYTADVSEADFAAGILALAAAGCKVICDDVTYFDEPFFQTGEVASAIQTVEQEGVTFLTCAGNQASAAYMSAWTPISSTTFEGQLLTDAQNFGGSTDPSPLQTIVNDSGFTDTLVIQWNQPYGSAATTIEAVFFSGGSFIGAVSSSGGDPYIIVGLTADASYQVAIEVVSGPDPGEIADLFYNDTDPSTVSLQDANFSTVDGHHASPYAITVGAVDAANTPGDGGTLGSEDFSSSGEGAQLFLNANGTAVANAPLDLDPVSVSGIDDITTTVSNGLGDFFGTSAATPSVAGIAADMLQANPALTPMEVKQILEETATGFGDPNVAGSGLANASAAIAAALDTVNWTVGNGDWDTAADWSGDAIPNDNFDAGISTSNSVTVTHSGGAANIVNTLLVDMNDTLNVISGSVAVDSSAMILGTLEVDVAGGQDGGAMTVGGTLAEIAGATIDIGNQNLTSATMVTAGGFLGEGPTTILGNPGGAAATLAITGSGVDTGPITVGGHAVLSASGGLTVSGAGIVTVSSGGTADNLIAANGGSAVILSGGIADDFDLGGSVSLFEVMDGAVVSGAVTFSGTRNELQLFGSSLLNNTISGLAPGDTIDLAGIAFSSSGTVDRTAGAVLQVNEGGNTYALNLDPTENFAGTFFRLSADPGSGTLVTVVGGQPSPDDFTGNGVSDILWGAVANNFPALWTMSGATIATSQAVTFQGNPDIPGPTWSFAGAGDFDGTGTDDMLWRNTDSTLVVWTMNGANVTASQPVTFQGALDLPPSSWSIAGIGDFDGSGSDGILWRNTDGLMAEWTMSGSTVTSSQVVTFQGLPDEPGATWSIAGVGDFTGDGASDVLWRNTDGTMALWTMNGAIVTSSMAVTSQGAPVTQNSTWTVAGIGDFTGNGVSDVLWRSSTDEELQLWTMNGAAVTASQIVTFQGHPDSPDATWSVAGIGDFLGDGTSDVLWHNTKGTVAVWTMNGATVMSSQAVTFQGALDFPDNTWRILA